MKTRILSLLLFMASNSFSQTVNDYKGVIIPMKFGFLNTENQYRLQTISKMNLQKAGFQAFYEIEAIPAEINNRCSLLYFDVKKENAFLLTKLYIVFKDCYGTIIYQSPFGKSREKEFEIAYSVALNEAFISIYDLNYKYNGNTNFSSIPSGVSPSTTAVVSPVSAPSVAVIVPVVNQDSKEPKSIENKSTDLLYAQSTPYGYQLIDSQPKVIFKLFKTSNTTSFIAFKGSVQGVLVSSENKWLFEYYQNDEKISENVEVKF
ncbi:hypothetical protein [Flavobacterium sp.]|uniref:hypothetical protein n=1 Tax=Flavobacterium sp. TaxID=239 RepID=UPI0038FC9894